MPEWIVICLDSFPLEKHVLRVVQETDFLSTPLRLVIVEADDAMVAELRKHEEIVQVMEHPGRRGKGVPS